MAVQFSRVARWLESVRSFDEFMRVVERVERKGWFVERVDEGGYRWYLFYLRSRPYRPVFRVKVPLSGGMAEVYGVAMEPPKFPVPPQVQRSSEGVVEA